MKVAQPAAFLAEALAQVVAFYLPQYHAIRENSEWWGEGFTDWVNVRRARPLFEGHRQPRAPTALGHYDLLDPAIHHAQATLARTYGVAAFCYYAYWFRGERLLERPLALVAAHPDLAMPYAICWANESWSRRWDGSEHQVLMEQHHSPESDPGFIDDIAHHLIDPRYVRVQGRPLVLIYRPGLLVDPLRTTDALRARAVALGIGDLYLAMVQSFGHWEPLSYGFDAAVEFPPHNLAVAGGAALHTPRALAAGRSRVSTASYLDAARVALSRPVPEFAWYRGVMPDWDNTPRRGSRGTAYEGATPDRFRRWLEAALECTYLFRPPGERLVFVNAWNEWAEGAHLEPDETFGDGNLAAVRAALDSTADLAVETAMMFRANAEAADLLRLARQRWTGRPWASSPVQ